MFDPRNHNQLKEALAKFEALVHKICFTELNCLPVCDLKPCLHTIKLIKIETLTTSTGASFYLYVLNALGGLKNTIGYILHSSPTNLCFYIGLKGADNCCTALKLLENGLKATFPNSKFKELSPKESSALLQRLFNPEDCGCLSSAIVVPNHTDVTHAPILENFTMLMSKEEYTALFLASPIDRCEMRLLLEELTCLFDCLSCFSQATHNFLHGLSKNGSNSSSICKTESNSLSCTETNSSSFTCNDSAYTNITPSTALPLANTRSLNISVSSNKTEGHASSNTESCSECKTRHFSEAKTSHCLNATTINDNESITFSSQNKEVQDILAKLTLLIARLKANLDTPFFDFAAYFLSPCPETSLRAAYTYVGLAKDTTLNLEESFINTWHHSSSDFITITGELAQFNHPVFLTSPDCHEIIGATPITSSELLNTLTFPFTPTVQAEPHESKEPN